MRRLAKLLGLVALFAIFAVPVHAMPTIHTVAAIALPQNMVDFISGLLNGPLMPLITSGVVWAFNQWNKFKAVANGWKIILVLAGPPVFLYLMTLIGIPVTSVQSFASGAVAIIIYHIGHAKGATS